MQKKWDGNMEESEIKNRLEEILIKYLGEESISSEYVNKVYDDYFKDENINSKENVLIGLKAIERLFTNFVDDSEFDEEE